MKRLYLIRHAKSKWSDVHVDDFARPLSRRGKEDGPAMAARLVEAGIRPDLIVASPAKRAKETAEFMAKGTGYTKKIRYFQELYLGSLEYHLRLIDELLREVDALFLIGHNNTITELGEYLTGTTLGNVPTCGIVAVAFPKQQGLLAGAADATMGKPGKLLFFDFPKNRGGQGAHHAG